jgi:hypothetical protein
VAIEGILGPRAGFGISGVVCLGVCYLSVITK